MDIDYNAVFGLEDTGAQATESADPSTELDTVGENAQEPADPVEQYEDDTTDENGIDNTEDPEKQSAEENARFAAARRKAEAERDAAVTKAQADAQKAIDDMVKSLRITDPYTGKLLETKAEYDAYNSRQEEQRRERIRKRSGMDEQELNDLVKGSPEYNEALKRADQAEAALSEVRQKEEDRAVEEQLAEISKMNPAIKSIADLAKMPNYSDFYRLVRENKVSLVEAYRLANHDSIVQEAETRGRQAALNANSGKNHLGKTATRGAGAITVPADVAAEYRIFNPNATDAEISAHYNRYMKR